MKGLFVTEGWFWQDVASFRLHNKRKPKVFYLSFHIEHGSFENRRGRCLSQQHDVASRPLDPGMDRASKGKAYGFPPIFQHRTWPYGKWPGVRPRTGQEVPIPTLDPLRNRVRGEGGPQATNTKAVMEMWAQWDLNPRPRDYESPALTN